MKAVILAAGYATRLYPLTLNKPKCLLTIGDQTILDLLCDKLGTVKDLDEVVVVTNAKFFDQLNGWKAKRKTSLPVRVLNDGTTSNENRLGAIGDLNFALRHCGPDSDVLMMASDNLFDQDLAGFANFSNLNRSSICVALYDIKDKNLAAKKFGVLEMNTASEITGFEEKPERPKSSLIGMGVYYFPKDSLKLVGEYLNRADAEDAPGHYVRWLMDRVKILGFLFSGLWYDIGNLEALEEANQAFKQKKS